MSFYKYIDCCDVGLNIRLTINTCGSFVSFDQTCRHVLSVSHRRSNMLPQTCSPCSIYWDGFCHCLDYSLILLHLKFLGYVHLHLITQCDGVFQDMHLTEMREEGSWCFLSWLTLATLSLQTTSPPMSQSMMVSPVDWWIKTLYTTGRSSLILSIQQLKPSQ